MLKFRHTCIVVTNLAKSLDFYINKLGMKIITEQEISGEYAEKVLGIPKVKLLYVKLDFDENIDIPRFELHYYLYPLVEDVIPFGHISLTVDNLEEEYKRLSKLNVPFVSPPLIAEDTGKKVCFCADPDYNLIELVEDIE